MQEIYKNVIELLNNKEYGKILKIIIGIFVFTAPSISCIFIYERELFMTLDIIKFSILCFILNLILIIGVFIVVLLCKINKFFITIKDLNDKHEKELKNIQDNEETEQIKEQKNRLIETSESVTQVSKLKTELYEETFVDTVLFITTYTMLIWAYQFIFSYFNIPFVSDYGIVTMLIYMFVYIFKSILDIFKVNKANGIVSSIKDSFYLAIMQFLIIIFFVVESIIK